MFEVEVVVVVLWMQFSMCFKVVAVMVTVLPVLKNMVEQPYRIEKRLKRNGKEKVVTAVVVMTE